MACLFGHKWNGCTCERCGKNRYEQHDFRPLNGRCLEECTICRVTRNLPHQWNGCKCTRCGEINTSGHHYQPIEGTELFLCPNCGTVAIRMNDLPQAHMQVVFTALEKARQSRAKEQIINSMAVDLDGIKSIEDALSNLETATNPLVNASNILNNGMNGIRMMQEMQLANGQVNDVLEQIRQKKRALTDYVNPVAKPDRFPGRRTSAAASPAFSREAYLEQLRREGKITDEKIERMNKVRALRPQVTDFATYVNLSLDQSELDGMEQKLLAEGDIGSQAVFQFLYDCGMGRMGNGVMWWKQAKRLTRMLVKFQDPKLKGQLTLLANLAERTNVREYHTEIANVAKEELEKLS